MIHIRQLQPKDRQAIRQLLEKTAMFTAQEIGVALELIDIYLNNQDQKDYYFFVAELPGGKTAGYCCYGPAPITEGTYDLYWIAVSPELQQQGIGRQLLQHTEREILRQKGRLVIIETSSQEKYAPTQQFYLRNHYQIAARIKDFYRPGDDRLIYSKYLTTKN